MTELLKKSIALGLGAILVTEEKMRDIVKEFVNKGSLKADEGEKLAHELLSKVAKSAEEVEKALSGLVRKVLEKLEIPAHSDLSRLEKRIEALEKRLGCGRE